MIIEKRNIFFDFNWNQKIYRLFYYSMYYVYPKYELPYQSSCDSWWCIDVNRNWFERIVSNPCKD